MSALGFRERRAQDSFSEPPSAWTSACCRIPSAFARASLQYLVSLGPRASPITAQVKLDISFYRCHLSSSCHQLSPVILIPMARLTTSLKGELVRSDRDRGRNFENQRNGAVHFQIDSSGLDRGCDIIRDQHDPDTSVEAASSNA